LGGRITCVNTANRLETLWNYGMSKQIFSAC
jgi:hypothetical protein